MKSHKLPPDACHCGNASFNIYKLFETSYVKEIIWVCRSCGRYALSVDDNIFVYSYRVDLMDYGDVCREINRQSTQILASKGL